MSASYQIETDCHCAPGDAYACQIHSKDPEVRAAAWKYRCEIAERAMDYSRKRGTTECGGDACPGCVGCSSLGREVVACDAPSSSTAPRAAPDLPSGPWKVEGPGDGWGEHVAICYGAGGGEHCIVSQWGTPEWTAFAHWAASVRNRTPAPAPRQPSEPLTETGTWSDKRGHRPPPISEEARAAREPLPPHVLLGGEPETIVPAPGRPLPARQPSGPPIVHVCAECADFGHRVYRRGTCRRDGTDHDMGESCERWNAARQPSDTGAQKVGCPSCGGSYATDKAGDGRPRFTCGACGHVWTNGGDGGKYAARACECGFTTADPFVWEAHEAWHRRQPSGTDTARGPTPKLSDKCARCGFEWGSHGADDRCVELDAKGHFIQNRHKTTWLARRKDASPSSPSSTTPEKP
jgi:hypothetical protein